MNNALAKCIFNFLVRQLILFINTSRNVNEIESVLLDMIRIMFLHRNVRNQFFYLAKRAPLNNWLMICWRKNIGA